MRKKLWLRPSRTKEPKEEEPNNQILLLFLFNFIDSILIRDVAIIHSLECIRGNKYTHLSKKTYIEDASVCFVVIREECDMWSELKASHKENVFKQKSAAAAQRHSSEKKKTSFIRYSPFTDKIQNENVWETNNQINK